MKKIILSLIMVMVPLFCSCGLDNYTTPHKTLSGKVVDVKTGNNIQTRQPDGIEIRLLDQKFKDPTPFNFWAKRDGSFNNTRIPSSKYVVFPINGPFEQSSVKKKTVDLENKNKVNITFKVEPYVRITNVKIEKLENDGIKATYKLSPNKKNRKILKSSLIAFTSPILHDNTTGKSQSTVNNLASKSNGDIANMTFVDKIQNLNLKNLKKGESYYARIEVLTDNSLKRYNYSKIVKIEF